MGYNYYVDINVLREVNGGLLTDVSDVYVDGGTVTTTFTATYDGYNI